jgi:hypothetical protein
MSAQSVKWEAGLMVGGTGYQGDLVANTIPDFGEIGTEYAFILNRRLNDHLGLRFQAAYASYNGQDDYRFRGFSFEGELLQFHTALKWAPSLLSKGALQPYLLAGIGVSYVDVRASFPSTEDEDLLLKIKADEADASSQVLPVMPIGIGATFDLSPRFALMGELGTQSFFSDHLDAISQTANPDANDWLSFARAGLVMRFLPKDSDRDGIADEVDACPDVKGAPTAAGCPDADLDGVEDLEDLCPEVAGSRLLNGCPDQDMDGIADLHDKCPYQKGPKSAEGCPDWDEDGLTDLEDRCPRLPGLAAREGCPVLDTNADGRLEDEAAVSMLYITAEVLERIDEHHRLYEYLLNGLILHLKEEPAISTEPEFDF